MVNTALAAILVAIKWDRRMASGSGIRAGMVFGMTRLQLLAVAPLPLVLAPTQVAVAVDVMAASLTFAAAAMAAAASAAEIMACELRR